MHPQGYLINASGVSRQGNKYRENKMPHFNSPSIITGVIKRSTEEDFFRS